MQLEIYPKLSTCSRRSMSRPVRQRKAGITVIYHYIPRRPLMQRLMRETGLSQPEILKQINKERKFLLDNGL